MKAPAEMTAGEINKALDKLDAVSSRITDELIEAGRGYETYEETYRKTDPLAEKYKAASDARSTLRREVERRYGPGAPSRLPKGFGPLKLGGFGAPKKCSRCGETSEWESMKPIGHQVIPAWTSPEGEFDPGEVLELKNCRCGSTLAELEPFTAAQLEAQVELEIQQGASPRAAQQLAIQRLKSWS